MRNGLVHGGPIDDEMAISVVFFMDWLAAEALHTAIKGLVADHDLIDHFLDRREEYERCLLRLQKNESPAEAMFWPRVENSLFLTFADLRCPPADQRRQRRNPRQER